jgi:dienelactone hydrolase
MGKQNRRAGSGTLRDSKAVFNLRDVHKQLQSLWTRPSLLPFVEERCPPAQRWFLASAFMHPTRLPLLSLVLIAPLLRAAEPNAADRMFAEYFRQETERLHTQSLSDVKTVSDWTAARPKHRAELLEMLGLAPLPEKTDLKATVTGIVDHPDFTVEKLHYQSLPGLYVTANLYVPKNLAGKKVPAVLYVCGHGNVKERGVSYGAKAVYQHHGAWFARHGYVSLIIDTIELGELEGEHHGTYRRGMWWWNARGYTPEGVEVWNSIRALDYLQSRPEVDGEKLGMTGRSGGGAYTWYTAAVDERVKVAVPVAGITDLHNHVIDGTVAGHCDCMFMVNTYRWDYAKLAAMVAPRPLLFSNSDKDRIFPLEGVIRVHRDLARIYELHQASDKLGLLITEGPHKDTQELQVPAFRWFNRWLKNEDQPITVVAGKLFTPQQLRVFAPGAEPKAQRTTTIHESFVSMASPGVPANPSAWQQQRSEWMQSLREKVFYGWPADQEPLGVQRTNDSPGGASWSFTSQGPVRLPMQLLAGKPATAKRVYLLITDGAAADASALLGTEQRKEVEKGGAAVVAFAPRGLGATASAATEKDQLQIRRRYLLLGQTVDGMRVWDIQRAVAALRQPDVFGDKPVHLIGVRQQAVNALYASLFIEGLASVEMIAPPSTHMTGPDYLNVLRFLDVPQTAVMAAERQPLKWTQSNPDDWSWTNTAVKQLGWPSGRIQF